MTTQTKSKIPEELLGSLKDGVQRILDDKDWAGFLNMMRKIHHYSFNNRFLIALEQERRGYGFSPLVAGFHKWKNEFKRTVKKGEKSNIMSALLIAEHNNKEVKPFTLNAITAASQIDEDLHVLVIGNKSEEVAKSISQIPNVKKVIHVDNEIYENFLAENFTSVIVKQAENYSHIICSANTFGKNLMPRVAALLDTSQVSDIIKVISADTFLRPIYAGNAFATVKSSDSKKCITIRPTSFDPAATSGGSAEIVKADAGETNTFIKFIKREEIKSDRPELGTARVVISGGRGMGSGENFKLITEIADKLNAAIGASRAAVDAGYITNDHQVGQTGKVVVPDLYIAVGISGAIQHLAGMKESKVIVAINKDGEAPIFSVADYGLEADLFEALPQFLEELSKLNTIQK